MEPIVNSIIYNKDISTSNNVIKVLMINGLLVNDENQISNHLNNYYVTAGENLVAACTPPVSFIFHYNYYVVNDSLITI